ncbi:AAA family ATPase [Nonomuraea sp. NPDC050540]|uniref:nSTAND1 domain-containing NTPase n=1 Tax=Nonomuraea sp. NPDC050540 TaxID=3364367 RepID=UPI00379B0E06
MDRNSTQLQVSVGLQYRQAIDIRLLMEQVAAIERRTRSVRRPDLGAGQAERWRTSCPYRGLMAFTEADAEVFYGREMATAELVSTLARRSDGAGILVVTGPSGAGKSSLLRAGLMPAIARGELSEQARGWIRHLLERPTRSPLSRLATLIAGMAGLDAPAVREHLAAQPEQAHLLARQAVESEARRRGLPDAAVAACRMVLVVDQFEEVFAQSADEKRQAEAAAERTAFVSALHALASVPCGPDDSPAAVVVIAVRGDFVDRCADDAHLAAALRDGPFVLGPMSEGDLRRAITGPAEAAGLEIELGLIDTILAELRAARGGYGVGALPLLSQAMLTTWEYREDDRLTSRGYGRTGGVTQAVATSAEAAYTALDAAGQVAARQVFDELTVVTADGVPARRAASRSALPAGELLETFARRRLIVIDGESVQIAHDVLLTAWPRLRGWLAADLAAHPVHRQLVDDARAWDRSGRKSAYLYRGERLAGVRSLMPRRQADTGCHPALPRVSHEFLDAAARAQAGATRRRRVLLSILTVSLVVAVVAAVAALRAQQDTSRQRDAAVSRRLAAQSELLSADPDLSALLAVAAWRISPTDEARAGMLTALRDPGRAVLTAHGSGVNAIVSSVAFSPDGRLLASNNGYAVWLWEVAARRPIASLGGHTNEVFAVAFSPDGRLLASGTGDGTVALWDVATRRQVGTPMGGGGNRVRDVAFSPDGRLLAGGTEDGTIRLWDVAARKPAGTLTGHGDAVLSLAFSPDGRTLVSGSEDHTMRLWNVAARKPIDAPIRGYIGSVDSVAFSPDGHSVAGSGGGSVRLWDVASREPTGPFLPGADFVSSVAFSSDGRTFATGADGTVQLWNVATQRPVGAPLTGHAGEVFSLRFSSDGRSLAGGGADGTVRLWDVTARTPVRTRLSGHSDEVSSLAFSPDGRTLASGTDGVVVRLLDTAAREPVSTMLGGHDNHVRAVAFSPDGRLLASGDDDSVRLWDMATREPVGVPMTGHTAQVYSVDFSPDGRTVASGRSDGTVMLWDVASRRPVGAPFGGPGDDTTFSVTFSPDGRILAGSGGDGVVRLWDVATRELIGPPLTGHTAEVGSVAFSPDGRSLASAGRDGTVRLWDVATRRPIGAPLTGHTAEVYSVAFSPDGRVLASGSGDRTVRLWDVATRGPIGPPLTGHTAHVFSVAFSPDGRRLVAGSDGAVWTWEVGVPRYLDDAVCAIPARTLTRAEWAQHMSEVDFRIVCR